MATLEQLSEAVTEQLRERVERLVSAVEDDAQDFTAIANVADSVAEFADTVGDIYTDLERRLLGGSESDDGNAQGRRSRAKQPQGAHSESTSEDATKDELLEQARELHVEGRSSMTKEELAQAVEAEESVTKDELLECARDANIEGRSSMTKEELRDALHEAGA